MLTLTTLLAARTVTSFRRPTTEAAVAIYAGRLVFSGAGWMRTDMIREGLRWSPEAAIAVWGEGIALVAAAALLDQGLGYDAVAAATHLPEFEVLLLDEEIVRSRRVRS